MSKANEITESQVRAFFAHHVPGPTPAAIGQFTLRTRTHGIQGTQVHTVFKGIQRNSGVELSFDEMTFSFKDGLE